MSENLFENNSKKIPNYVLFCDGGSRGNPGKSASGWAIFKIENFLLSKLQIVEFCRSATPVIKNTCFLGITTNNVAEWTALEMGLKDVKKHFGQEINILTLLDSELVCKQVLEIYKVKKNHLLPLFNSVKKSSKEFSSFKIEHIYRNDNKLADSLVNECLDNQ